MAKTHSLPSLIYEKFHKSKIEARSEKPWVDFGSFSDFENHELNRKSSAPAKFFGTVHRYMLPEFCL